MAVATKAEASDTVVTLTPEQAWHPAQVVQATLSPDGRHIAALALTGTNSAVLLIPTDTLAPRVLLAGRRASYGHAPYAKVPTRALWVTPELLAIDFNGEAEVRDLTGRRLLDLGQQILGKAQPKEPNSPWLLVWDDDRRSKLKLVNVVTKATRLLPVPVKGELEDWTLDENMDLRALTMSTTALFQDQTTVDQWYLPPGQTEWVKLLSHGLNDESWFVLEAPATRHELVVRSREGRDTYAYFRYDTQKRVLGEVLAGHPTEDIVAVGVDADDRYRRVVTNGMKPTQIWFDPKMAALQRAVDEVLPDRLNLLSTEQGGKVLIHTQSMTQRLVVEQHPKIKPALMRPKEVIHYRADDGLRIPAYLTRPAESRGALPMVVLVHGGPVARDTWTWDAEAQLLAAEGFVVFQPQFRGSAGFGKAFEQAGYGQWGLAMQDDISAGVRHLVEQGIADPKRVCIYGASYGGYAAMWGLAKTPDLYRCGVTLAGVSDIASWLTGWSDAATSKETRQVLRVRVGDPAKDKGKFDAVSPVVHAHRIKSPVLIVHGGRDQRVRIEQAERLRKALRKAGNEPEWIEYPGEGHGLVWEKNQVEFSKALIAFLKRHTSVTP